MSLKGKFFPKNPQKYIGNPNNIVFRSAWERTFMEYCDKHSNITKWASEEIAIPYYFVGDSKWHKYYPDFLIQVNTHDNKHQVWMVEIKPDKQTRLNVGRPAKSTRRHLTEALTYAKNQAKWKAAENYCEKKGWKFKVVTEKDLYPKNQHK